MSTRRFRVVVVAALYFLAAAPTRCAEPSYQGKALSEWLLELQRKPSAEEVLEAVHKQQDKQQEGDSDPVFKVYEDKRKRDGDAIRQMGKSALPTLLEMLGATSENITNVVRQLKASEFHEDWWGDESHVDDLRSIAIEGFEVLGTNADSAVPELTKLLREAETSFDASRALTKIGPKGLAVLTNALNNPDDPARNAAIWSLGEASIDDKTKDSLLIQRLNDKDDVNRHNAAQFLTGKDASAIPLLIKMLDEDTNYLAVSGAADALAKFGAAAKDAVPKLFSIYTNHVGGRDRHDAQSWAFSVMSALRAIDLNAAAKAELFLVNSGPLNFARSGYTVTMLTNGQELITGGYVHTEVTGVSNKTLASAQLNDPVTGKWKETGPLNTARDSHTATLLRNGKVLITGGTEHKGHALASCELYDIATGKWTEAASLKTGRYYHTAGLQADGRVMVAGGHTGSNPLSDTEFYDPINDEWTAGSAITNLLPAVRQLHSATLLQNGKVLIAGGQGPLGSGLGSVSTAELYDPRSVNWTNTGAMKVARIAHQGILLSNGKVLVIGGTAYDGSGCSAELFEPATGQWKLTGEPMTNRWVNSATLLQNGKVLVTGAEGLWKRRSFAQLYDPVIDKWSPTGALPDLHEAYTATLLSNGKVLIAGGGWSAGGTVAITADAQIYDPATGKWAATGPLNEPRWRHTASLLADGRVLVAGGAGSWLDALPTAELYDPKTGQWTLTGAMRNARYDHTATLLPTGEVLVLGSFENSGEALSTAEVYEPKTGKWRELRRLNAEHNGHTATLLPAGKILIVGGNAVGRVEIFEPLPVR